MADKTLIIKESTLKDIANAIREKSGSTDLIPVVNLDTHIVDMEIGSSDVGIIKEVTESPNNAFGYTSVPNTGYVEKIYFNTKIKPEQIYNILQKLEYTRDTSGNQYYHILNIPIDEYTSHHIYAAKYEYGSTYYYTIQYGLCERNGYNTQHTIYISEYPSGANPGVYFIGLNPDIESYMEFNSNAAAEFINRRDYDKMWQAGHQNKLIDQLISSTPFNYNTVAEEDSVVPNTGHVDNIYINNTISVDDVVSILNKLDYVDMGNNDNYGYRRECYSILGFHCDEMYGGNDGYSRILTVDRCLLHNSDVCVYAINIYAYASDGTEGSFTSIFNYRSDFPEGDDIDRGDWLDMGFNGWSPWHCPPDIPSIKNINLESTINTKYANYTNIGHQNNLLTELVSTKPFKFPKDDFDEETIYRIDGITYKFSKKTGWYEVRAYEPNSVYVVPDDGNPSKPDLPRYPDVTKLIIDSLSNDSNEEITDAENIAFMCPSLSTLEVLKGIIPDNFLTNQQMTGVGTLHIDDLILNKDVTMIGTDSLSNSSGEAFVRNVYFKGTIEEWRNVTVNDNFIQNNVTLYVLDSNDNYYPVFE